MKRTRDFNRSATSTDPRAGQGLVIKPEASVSLQHALRSLQVRPVGDDGVEPPRSGSRRWRPGA
jgi:hypothetical protein